MKGPRAAGENRLEPGAPRPQTEIDVLETEEIVLVEETHRLEHLTLDQHETAADRIDDLDATQRVFVHLLPPRPVPHASAPGAIHDAERGDAVWCAARQDDRPGDAATG